MYEKQLSNREIAHFSRTLSLLLHAGIGTGSGLILMAEEKDEPHAELYKAMGDIADSGQALAYAMEECGGFPSYVVGMTKVGEESGRLEEALMALSIYYERQHRLIKALRSALAYPAMLLMLVLIVIGVLLVKVLPIFNDVYLSLGSRLTGFSAVLLKIGQAMSGIMPLIIVLLIIAAVFVILLSVSENVRNKVINSWKKKSGDKGISRKINDAHFAQALSMGLSSGLSLENSIELAGELLKDTPSAVKRCEDCIASLSEGDSLSEALRKNEVLPISECRLLELGFKGGNADTVMDDISFRLMEDAEESIDSMTSKIEPAIVLCASLLVGVILISVMLPLMNIMSAIG